MLALVCSVISKLSYSIFMLWTALAALSSSNLCTAKHWLFFGTLYTCNRLSVWSLLITSPPTLSYKADYGPVRITYLKDCTTTILFCTFLWCGIKNAFKPQIQFWSLHQHHCRKWISVVFEILWPCFWVIAKNFLCGASCKLYSLEYIQVQKLNGNICMSFRRQFLRESMEYITFNGTKIDCKVVVATVLWSQQNCEISDWSLNTGCCIKCNNWPY